LGHVTFAWLRGITYGLILPVLAWTVIHRNRSSVLSPWHVSWATMAW